MESWGDTAATSLTHSSIFTSAHRLVFIARMLGKNMLIGWPVVFSPPQYLGRADVTDRDETLADRAHDDAPYVTRMAGKSVGEAGMEYWQRGGRCLSMSGGCIVWAWRWRSLTLLTRAADWVDEIARARERERESRNVFVRWPSWWWCLISQQSDSSKAISWKHL